MEWIKPDIHINFVKYRYAAFAVSAVLIAVGIVALVARGGLNLGVDFAGGTLIQVQFKKDTTPDAIRKAMGELAEGSAVQQIGAASEHEFLIRTDAETQDLQALARGIETDLSKTFGEGEVNVRRVEMVGPKVGHDLRQKALFAIYYAIVLITIYISGRFEFKWGTSGIMAAVLVLGIYLLEVAGLNVTALIFGALAVTLVLCWLLRLPFALGALLSLLHDVLITVGAFGLTNKEFTLEVLAAVLTLVGFSLNDTIVIYDRIRENQRKTRPQDFHELVNTSVNQTLSRTILTSGTVFAVTLCLFLFGGSVIHDFSFALLVGLISGTYSTVFVASAVLIIYEDLNKGKRAARKSATA